MIPSNPQLLSSIKKLRNISRNVQLNLNSQQYYQTDPKSEFLHKQRLKGNTSSRDKQ